MEEGKVNGERNLAKTNLVFSSTVFPESMERAAAPVDNTTLTLEECTGERVCARRL